jgi:hypothetical protein
MGSALDAWVVLPPDTTHFVYVRAWDASGSFLASPIIGSEDRVGTAGDSALTVSFYWKHVPGGFLRAQFLFGTCGSHSYHHRDRCHGASHRIRPVSNRTFDDGVMNHACLQCHYRTNQWQLWLPENGARSGQHGSFVCQFQSGLHHMTYFLGSG